MNCLNYQLRLVYCIPGRGKMDDYLDKESWAIKEEDMLSKRIGERSGECPMRSIFPKLRNG